MPELRREQGGKRLLPSALSISPLVSIVIVVFRARPELLSLLKSIFSKERGSFEVIVVDGGSDDGSVDLLREWSDRIDYWISEPDNGIYDAMNKGLEAARGEFVWHLNAGDHMRQIPWDSLEFCHENNIDVLSCCVLMDGERVFVPRLGFRLKIENWWHHQGTFYRRTAHMGYDTGFLVYGDFDLNQRMAKAGRAIRLSSEVVADHRNDGISVTGRNSYRQEFLRIVSANSGMMFVPIAYAWSLLIPARTFLTGWRHRFDDRR